MSRNCDSEENKKPQIKSERQKVKDAKDKDKKPKKFKYTTLDNHLHKCGIEARREAEPYGSLDDRGVC